MPQRKKLVLALSLLATGVGTALFFRKDASPSESRHEAQHEITFRQPVERRTAGDANLAQSFLLRRSQSTQIPRGPAAPTAAIADVASPAEVEPRFERSFHPVAALLSPFDSQPAGEPDSRIAQLDPPDVDQVRTEADGRTTVSHRVADGDTLMRLATRYYGQPDRYLEIFEQNRDVLASPDLLPIGVQLRITLGSK